ncbi:MAG: cytochrome C [Deltaproteobacteria bacterium]|nr:cytochrome C [Deltaproteobacteria bacterium]MBI2179931.1 cytochrome C [Deltaproteobacteria bacterium]MBI2231289.1 cytochrome C [Deltaproteobacteria bacterium]MBI2365491.1 cytochrome C [Deltaproteobacteria bacterium]
MNRENRAGKTKTVKYHIAILAAALNWYCFTLARAQEMEVIAGGEIEYQNYCAICHGVDGRGFGIMAKFLTVQPTDLTQLAKKYAGRFPFWQVYRTIDGREEVRGHGTRDMPVWGARFRADAKGDDTGSRSQIAGRILSLVFYLQHIQE